MIAPPSMQFMMGSVRKLPTDASVLIICATVTCLQPMCSQTSDFQMQLQKLEGNSLLDMRDIRLSNLDLYLSGAGTSKCIDSAKCRIFVSGQNFIRNHHYFRHQSIMSFACHSVQKSSQCVRTEIFPCFYDWIC